LEASVQSDNSRKMQRRTFIILTALFALIGVASIGYLILLEGLKQAARSPMVYFAEGPAVLGYGEKRVEHQLAAFHLEKFEVTIRQYDLCVVAGRCTPANIAYLEGEAKSDENLPVTWITAYQAATFCDWIGRRLPTVTEWERAVRGSEGRTWPWGEQSPVDPNPRVQIYLSEWPHAEPLQAPVVEMDQDFADGATPEGVWHLLGNVSEWTSTFATYSKCLDPYGEDCQIWNGKVSEVQALYIVGLGWSDDLLSEQKARVSEYYPSSPIEFGPSIGFRCAD